MKEKNNKIEISFRELMQYTRMFKVLTSTNPGFERTRFGVLFKNFLEKYADPVIEKYNREVYLLEIDNALADPTSGELLFDKNGKFKFSKEGLKNKTTEEWKLLDLWEDKCFPVEKIIAKKNMFNVKDEEMQIALNKIINFL